MVLSMVCGVLSGILFPWISSTSTYPGSSVASVNCLVGEQSDLPRTITDFPGWSVNCLVASL